PLALDQLFGDVLTIVLGQRRLGIEQIELRRRTRHEQVDDALHPRRVVELVGWRARSLRQQGVVDQRGERQPANPERGLFEEVSASEGAERWFRHARVTPW